jgi:hypothetical protein
MKKHILFLSLFCLACLTWQCKDEPKDDVNPAPTISSIGAGALGAKALPRQIFKIAGTNLEGAKVFFKNASGTDVQANIHSNTATEIYAFVPETAVTGAVRVETANGQTTSSSNFTVRTITVSTFVGNGNVSSGANGTGTAAGLGLVNSICLHPNGNLYAFQWGAIRKITPAGVVTTVAGSFNQFGTPVDGTGAAARFGADGYVAVDANENIYVSDNSYHKIRKVTPAGVVTTLAGSTQGNQDGVGANAKFNYPRALVVSGNFLYVGDHNNGSIRKIDVTNGTVTTLLSSIGASGGLDVDADGNFYAVSNGWGEIRSVSPAGVLNPTAIAGFYDNNNSSTSKGHQDGFPATVAKFQRVSGMAVIKSGAMKGGAFVVDVENNIVRLVYEGVSTIAGELPINTTGGYVDGSGVSARFKNANSIACDATGNTIYVADTQNHRIRKIVISD